MSGDDRSTNDRLTPLPPGWRQESAYLYVWSGEGRDGAALYARIRAYGANGILSMEGGRETNLMFEDEAHAVLEAQLALVGYLGALEDAQLALVDALEEERTR